MIRTIAYFLLLLTLTGCAHPITIQPQLNQIKAPAAAKPIPKTAALYIPDSLRQSIVTTPGGGGESVRYLPYQDLEASLLKMLRNTFADTVRLTAPASNAELQQRGVHYLLTPHITTQSSSSRFALWAPTDFKLTLRLTLLDVASGAQLSKEVTGEGKFNHATELNYASVSASHGSEAARRASLESLLKMQQTLLDAAELR
jgi:hypothetical protein